MAFILAKTDPQMVVRGEIAKVWKIPAKLMIKYGVHATNHREMVIKAI